MTSESAHKKRNKLTEHKTNYKLCNTYLTDCYAGLYPATLTKLSLVIFSTLLSTKRYHKPDSKFYSPEEDRRIFTNVVLTPSNILERCHPVKYIYEGKDSSKDASNMVRKINELDDNNIFYAWRYGYPHMYMFVMERDIGVWKFYNPSAYVTPKTLRKVIYSTKGMVASMLEMSGKGDVEDVRNSFCEFINGLILKMHPDVQEKLTLWVEGDLYRSYLTGLRNEIDKLEPYEGLVEHEGFYDRLPAGVKEKMKPVTKKRESHPELEDYLAPKDENLVKPKGERKKRTAKAKKDPSAEAKTFLAVDPFKDVNNFVGFYRAAIYLTDRGAKFFPYSTELHYASQILDILHDNEREDKRFLKSWIGFYIEKSLKGNNMYKEDNTSLKKLKESFEEYNNRYVSFQV